MCSVILITDFNLWILLILVIHSNEWEHGKTAFELVKGVYPRALVLLLTFPRSFRVYP